MESFKKFTAQNLGISISNDQLNKFLLFEAILIKWNSQYNLTSITDHKDIIIKHFYDSLTCFKYVPLNNKITLIDVGTGAGFPGIPLAIMNPEIQLTLVESVGKKADFCQIALQELEINNSRVLASRAETVGREPTHREQYDWAVARAVAPLSTLAEYLIPLVRIGGSVLAQKGVALQKEIRESKKAIFTLGGKIKETFPIALPEEMGNRTLILVKKNKNTPSQYPRRPGTPKKNPIF
jgi:16S rRNA (guanine527-N7)-methyltransferase